MASSPITSWQIDWEIVETVIDLIFLGFKIPADGDYSHEINKCLLLGRKDMTNLDSTLKSRDITLLTKVHLVKAMVFPEVMYGCESWTMKKAEHWRTVMLEKTVESPLDCNELKPVNHIGNQSWIFIGRTDAETPILWPSDVKTNSLEKTLMLGKTEGRRRRDDRGQHGWKSSLTQWRWIWANSRRWQRTVKPDVLQSMGLKSRTRLRDWITIIHTYMQQDHYVVHTKHCKSTMLQLKYVYLQIQFQASLSLPWCE